MKFITSVFLDLLAFLCVALCSPVKFAALAALYVYETLRVSGVLPLAPLALGVNSFTGLIPDIYKAFDVVSRESVGYIPAVTRDSSADRVALGQTLRSFVAPPNTAGRTITPAMAFPVAAYQTIGNKALTITKSRAFPYSWTGEDEYAVNSNGPGSLTIQQDQIAQCFRAGVNEMELDLAGAAQLGASRAVGTAGTTPFNTTVAGTSLAGQVLIDNGAPKDDWQAVINTSAGANLRTLMQLTRVNEGGTDATLRNGELLNINRFSFKESGQIVTTVSGTAAGATTDNAGYAVGATTLTLASAGTGTLVAGDVITFAGDTNKYVVVTGDTDVSNGGTVVIQAPGLRVAMSAATKAITVGAAYTPNSMFRRSALVLGTRLPAIPKAGDLAIWRDTLTDPVSKIVWDVSIYPGYKMFTLEVGLNWGWFTVKPEHICTLLG